MPVRALLVSLAAALALPMQAAKAAAPPAADAGVYLVVHVDIEPAALPAAQPIMQAFAARARHDPAVSSFDLLEQTGAENHFTLVEAMPSQQAYATFAGRAYVKQWRASIQPLLGGPFDERVHHAVALP